MANSKAKKKISESQGGPALLLPAVFGVAATAITAVAMALILGRVAYLTDDPLQYAAMIGMISLYFPAFCGGMLSNIRSGRRFASVAIHAVILLFMIVAFGLFSGSSLSQNLLRKLLVVPCSLLGGALCYLKIPRKRKPKFKGRNK